MSVRGSGHVSEFCRTEGGGVLSCVETRGKANILHNTPSHTFLGSLKGAASGVCLIILQSWLEETAPTQAVRGFKTSFIQELLSESHSKQFKDTYLCFFKKPRSAEMFLSVSVLVLLLSEVVLGGVLRACPTCKGRQAPAGLNTTALVLGEPCGVYTPKCAHGLRCAPPQDEPRPLRALLEGRGACSYVSTSSTARTTTTQVHTEGRSHHQQKLE